MKKPNIGAIVKSARASLVKHSPEILTGLGIAGMLTAGVLAVKATPKALQLIEQTKTEYEVDELTAGETVKAAWKCYIPSVAIAAVSTACLIGANSVNARRNAALAAAYTLSDSALREYREKVVETIGEEKEKEVRDKVNKDKLKKNPKKDSDVVVVNKGDVLCYEPLSGRYFKSTLEAIKSAENELNKALINSMSVTLNDFYDELGLDHTKIGYDLAWWVEDGPVELEYSPQIADDGTPCIVVEYKRAPKHQP